MLKIKKFKISVHNKEILRRIMQAKIDITSAGFSSNGDVEDFIFELASKLDPGVVYETFETKDVKLEGIDMEDKTIFTAGIVSLGKQIEKEIEKENQKEKSTVINIAVLGFLKTAYNFVYELIKNQAKKENFEIDKDYMLYYPQFNYVREPKFIQTAEKLEKEISQKTINTLCDILKPEKIETKFIDDNFTSKYTIAFISRWSKKKRKGQK